MMSRKRNTTTANLSPVEGSSTDCQRPKRSKTEAMLEGLAAALSLAENALDGFPFPGAKLVIKGVLKCVDNAKTSCSNMETLRKLTEHVTALLDLVLEPLSHREESGIPRDLRIQVDRFERDLRALSDVWNRADSSRLRQFIQAKEDEKKLVAFSESVRRAVDRLHTSSQMNMWLSQNQILKELKDDRAQRRFEKMKDRVNSLRRAHTASYNAARTRKIESCFQGTRTGVLQEIREWALDPEKPHMFWLSGLAGTGKTTIARSVAEWAAAEGYLGASYFFARDVDDLRDPRLVFTTLAYQLAQTDDNLLQSISDAIEDDSDISHKEIPQQFAGLLRDPLLKKQESPTSWKLSVIVIDALDECEDIESVEAILNAVLRNAFLSDSNVRVFLTSRPEAHIRNVFYDEDELHQNIVLHDVEKTIVEGDIERYLRDGLSRIHARHRGRCPSDWPSPNQFGLLLKKSGSLFVYASVALRFIGNERAANPEKRLQILLSVEPGTASKSNPHAMLDELYLKVFQSAIADDVDDEDLRCIRHIVAAVVLLRNPIPFSSFAELLQTDKDGILQALYHLHSVIVVPSDDRPDEPPRFFHPSLPDFVTNPKRCSDSRFLIDVSCEEAYIFRCCFKIMNERLSYNLLDLGDTFTRISSGESCFENRAELLELTERVNRKIKPSLRYVLKYWTSHLSKVCCVGEHTDVIDELRIFAQEHLLHWIEATIFSERATLSWISDEVETVKIWAIEAGCVEISDLFHDVLQLLQENGQYITEYPLQVYHSVMEFVPRQTALYRAYSKHLRNTPLRLLSGANISKLPYLRGRSPRSLAYSQDNKWLAIGGEHGIDVCDAHDPDVCLFHLDQMGTDFLVFSPNSKHLVVATRPCERVSVVLWDISSRRAKTLLDLTTESAYCGLELSFSESQRQPNLVSLFRGQIRLWNSETGELDHQFYLGVSCITGFAFFPDGTQVMFATGSVIYTCHVSSGRILPSFTHTNPIRHVILSPTASRYAFRSWGSTGNREAIFVVNRISGDVVIAVSSLAREPLYRFLFSKDGKSIIAAGRGGIWRADFMSSKSSTIQTIHSSNYRPSRCAESSFPYDMVLSSDGNTLAIAFSKWISGRSEYRYDLTLFHLRDTDVSKPWGCEQWLPADCLAFSRDGSLLAAGSPWSRILQVWDAQRAELLYVMQVDNDVHIPGIKALEFSSDREWLISCRDRICDSVSHDELTIWNLRSRSVFRTVTVEDVPESSRQCLLEVLLGVVPLWIYRRKLTPEIPNFLSQWDIESSGRRRPEIKAHIGLSWSFRENEDTGGPQESIHSATSDVDIDANARGAIQLRIALQEFPNIYSFGEANRRMHWLFVEPSPSFPSHHSPENKSLMVTRRSPILLVPMKFERIRMASKGNRCALACGENGLLIFDISELENKCGRRLVHSHRVDATNPILKIEDVYT